MSNIYKLQYNGNTISTIQNRKTIHSYKSFKWILSGRWNQGSGNTGSTATYMEWDELGIGVENNPVRYGPDYWTYDSYQLDGEFWVDERNPSMLLDGKRNGDYTKFDAKNFTQLTVYFHTSTNKLIVPTSIGLISASNQNNYQSSTPMHFMLYGLNEDNNEYELLIDVNAQNVLKTNDAETVITNGFTYHYSEYTDKLEPLTFTYNAPEYTETLLWSGETTTKNQIINLSTHPSAFNCIKVLTYGIGDGGQNRQLPIVSYYDWYNITSRNGYLFVCNPMFGTTGTNGVQAGWQFNGLFTNANTTSWKWAAAAGTRWDSTGWGERFDFTKVRSIWGINYGL